MLKANLHASGEVWLARSTEEVATLHSAVATSAAACCAVPVGAAVASANVVAIAADRNIFWPLHKDKTGDRENKDVW